MIPSLSENTQAILLLYAPLLVGAKESAHKLLSLAEYNKLAKALRAQNAQPMDLLGGDADVLIQKLHDDFDKARLKGLLGRGFQLSQAVDAWRAKSIWVISRADPIYPRRLKQVLKEESPAVLYGCGDPTLLDTGGLSVVGSRNVDEAQLAFTGTVGKLTAEGGLSIVSGGARGIDSAAMNGALSADGTVIGVLGDSLAKAALAGVNRLPIKQNRLVLISPYDPSAGFNVGHAMSRNKLIYALSDAALVVTADFKKGGTWEGAVEQLDKYHFVPVFVCDGVVTGKGNQALIAKGGIRWPEPKDGKSVAETITRAPLQTELKQDSLNLTTGGVDSPASQAVETNKSAAPAPDNAITSNEVSVSDRFAAFVETLIWEVAKTAKTESEIADALGIPKSFAKDLIERMLKSGAVEKLSKPVRYKTVSKGERLI